MARLSENRPVRLAVTTSLNATPRVVAEAKGFSADSGCPYVPRKGRNIPEVLSEARMGGVIVVEKNGVVVRAGDAVCGFHPNTTGLRIVALSKEKRDRMVSAMGLRPGDAVLDCTCGLGTDAVVASYVVGEGGTVHALEASLLLALIVRRGLQTYVSQAASITRAMRRVRVIHATCEEVLADLPARSWDVVYFDPLFDSTFEDATGLDIVRLLGRPGAPTGETLQDGVRVARRCVVMKDRAPGEALMRLGFRIVSRGKKTCYGVMEV